MTDTENAISHAPDHRPLEFWTAYAPMFAGLHWGLNRQASVSPECAVEENSL